MSDRETVTIPKEEYESLLQDSQFLEALRANGVDNWEGYHYACVDVFGDEDEEDEELCD